ncbi:MAG: hypothetical protein KDA21_08255, partial [Phycisphaerales bacterium]|nr:hypothetical protein [Phycisphaerales bacterium]
CAAGMSTNYAFEEGIDQTARAWLEITTNQERKTTLQAMCDTHARLTDPKEVGSSILNLDTLSEIDQSIAANAMLVLAHLSREQAGPLWDAMSADSWRTKVMPSVSLEVLDVLAQAVRTLQVSDDQWRTMAPHFFASACLNEKDHDRAHFLFMLAVTSCITGDVASAVQRLLDDADHDFTESKHKARNLLIGIYDLAPAWVRGRIRALLAVM